MAYDKDTNPARRVADFGLTNGKGLYFYGSSHDSTEIAAASFFTDAGRGGPDSIGMSTGDILLNHNTQTNGISWHVITSLSTSTGWQSGIDATVGAGST